jgi:hypothetical protein
VLPTKEIRLLNAVTVRAVDLGEEGHTDAGYICLLEGSWRVADLQREGAGWACELAGCYRRVLDEYAERYWVARE